jgi:hypothetical protein
MKITTIKADRFNENRKEFLLDGKPVAVHTRGWDYYCSIKNGTRSRLRDKMKRADRFSWNFTTLRELLGDKFSSADFRISGPDHSWGYTGDWFNAKGIKEHLTAILSR